MDATDGLIVLVIGFMIIVLGLFLLFSSLNNTSSASAVNHTQSQVQPSQNNTPPIQTNSTLPPANLSNANPQPTSTNALLAETETVASVIQGAMNAFLAPTMSMGNTVTLNPFNVTIQKNPGEQTDYQTPDSLKAYNPYDPNIGAVTNHFTNNFYLEVFPSMPGGENQTVYPKTKNANGYAITYAVQNANSASPAYQISFPCYSNSSLGVNYIVQSSFSNMNYYNFTTYSWDELTFDDFINTMTNACSMIR